MKGKRPDYRHCHTHAMVAQMFAASAKDDTVRKAWEYVAIAWTDLATIRQQEEKGRPPHWPLQP